ncbi:MAG: hypothetical protein H6Q68_506 [Firmicutes bacterium]|nr:hypothetical protein [Bacillota bacterium]
MKKIVSFMVLGLSIYMTPVAFAESAKLTGDISVKYERDTADGSPNIFGTMSTFKLKAEKDLGAGWSLYARLGAQYATQPTLADYNLDAYGEDKKSVVALDQWGVTYNSGQLIYKIGRQDVSVGTTALLYSRSDGNIGTKTFADGLTAVGTIGAAEIATLLVKEDNAGIQDNKIYAIRVGYNRAANLNYGLTLGRYQDSINGSTNHWAVDGKYKFGSNSLTAEYTKSSSSTDNKGYVATWDYSFNDKTEAYITGFKVETNGDMGKQSDFDNDNRGFYYGITHKLSDTDILEFVYKNQKNISSGQNNNKFEATISREF